jgi:hypothetical protein
LGRALRCSVALALLAGCEDAPQEPGTGAAPSPSFAIGIYGVAGAPTAPAGRPCTRPQYRQFDFWLGNWEVTNPDGSPAGTSIISSALDGCAVIENYAQGGYVGRSINSYDAATDRWHQHYVDNPSQVARLFGHFDAGSMILQGIRPTPTSNRTINRITWSVLEPGLVRQLWEQSADSGATFPTVAFDGRYHSRTSVVQDPAAEFGACSDPTTPALFQFDFTVGSWDVNATGPHGSEGGPTLHSTITKEIDQCLIEEHISGRAGYEAIVFTAVRRRLGEWVKTLVDNRGTSVFLSGRETDGQMVLTGSVPSAGGASKDVRVSWHQSGPDAFEQRWETTTDGGATWERLLLAEYHRR